MRAFRILSKYKIKLTEHPLKLNNIFFVSMDCRCNVCAAAPVYTCNRDIKYRHIFTWYDDNTYDTDMVPGRKSINRIIVVTPCPRVWQYIRKRLRFSRRDIGYISLSSPVCCIPYATLWTPIYLYRKGTTVVQWPRYVHIGCSPVDFLMYTYGKAYICYIIKYINTEGLREIMIMGRWYKTMRWVVPILFFAKN